MEQNPHTGTVIFKAGNYFLEIEGKHQVIPIGPHIDVAQLRELVGQKVEVVTSQPQRFIVGLVLSTPKPKPPKIICYIPVDPNLFGVVPEDLRAGLAKQFLKEGLINKETYEKLG